MRRRCRCHRWRLQARHVDGRVKVLTQLCDDEPIPPCGVVVAIITTVRFRPLLHRPYVHPGGGGAVRRRLASLHENPTAAVVDIGAAADDRRRRERKAGGVAARGGPREQAHHVLLRWRAMEPILQIILVHQGLHARRIPSRQRRVQRSHHLHIPRFLHLYQFLLLLRPAVFPILRQFYSNNSHSTAP